MTGHRTLPDDPRFARVVADTLETLLAERPGAPVTLLSALAEGADRIVARIVLERLGTRLVAVLPMPLEEYVRDFETAESRAEFASLLARASETIVLPPCESRTAAYEAAGEAVVDRSDTLIAIWDGEAARGQGGTANVVARARERGRRVVWISTKPPFPMQWLEPTGDDPQ